ncbi:MAG: MerR family transcriptional regulator [Blastochloris sp.]|nr:MerR family transcriptional regulator [Blastochloris sp.]
MFKIRAFSKIALVPMTLLRYYDQIGLFSPAYVDPFTSYRYYRAEQLPELSRIMALKELGLSLQQITQLVRDEVSPAEIRRMYVLRKAQIEQNMQADLARLRIVETRLRQLEQYDTGRFEEVLIKAVPAQTYLSFRAIFAGLPEVEAALWELTQVVAGRLGSRIGHLVAVLYDEGFNLEQIDMEFGYILQQPLDTKLALPSGRVLQLSELPAIETAACSVRVGGFENCYLNYGALGAWVEANRYDLLTPHREVMLVPPLPLRNAQAVVEIQMPIRLRGD